MVWWFSGGPSRVRLRGAVDETKAETPPPWRRVHTLTRDVSTNHSQKAIRVTSYRALCPFFSSLFSDDVQFQEPFLFVI